MSLGVQEARKKAPVWKSSRLPSGVPPQQPVSKFQYTTIDAALPASTPQWSAVWKYGV